MSKPLGNIKVLDLTRVLAEIVKGRSSGNS